MIHCQRFHSLTLCLAVTALLSAAPPSLAQSSDKEMALKARELQQSDEDHAQHGDLPGTKGKFRGVYYGYLPCSDPDCSGLKMTLSLNANNNYLLVIQPASMKNRETFEKGKYDWNDETGRLSLTPFKESLQGRLMAIREDGLLILNGDGKAPLGDTDRYLLKRSDTAGNREMHIH